MVKNDKWRAKAELESNHGENKIKRKLKKNREAPSSLQSVNVCQGNHRYKRKKNLKKNNTENKACNCV